MHIFQPRSQGLFPGLAPKQGKRLRERGTVFLYLKNIIFLFLFFPQRLIHVLYALSFLYMQPQTVSDIGICLVLHSFDFACLQAVGQEHLFLFFPQRLIHVFICFKSFLYMQPQTVSDIGRFGPGISVHGNIFFDWFDS